MVPSWRGTSSTEDASAPPAEVRQAPCRVDPQLSLEAGGDVTGWVGGGRCPQSGQRLPGCSCPTQPGTLRSFCSLIIGEGRGGEMGHSGPEIPHEPALFFPGLVSLKSSPYRPGPSGILQTPPRFGTVYIAQSFIQLFTVLSQSFLFLKSQ